MNSGYRQFANTYSRIINDYDGSSYKIRGRHCESTRQPIDELKNASVIQAEDHDTGPLHPGSRSDLGKVQIESEYCSLLFLPPLQRLRHLAFAACRCHASEGRHVRSNADDSRRRN